MKDNVENICNDFISLWDAFFWHTLYTTFILFEISLGRDKN